MLISKLFMVSFYLLSKIQIKNHVLSFLKYVFTFYRTSEEVSALPKPILGLNGVSGRATLEVIKRLDQTGTVVTYGGMSKQVSVDT